MTSNNRRSIVRGICVLSILAVAFTAETAFAQDGSRPPWPLLEGTDFALDPLGPGLVEEIETKEQPDVTNMPYWDELNPIRHWFSQDGQGFARPSPGSATIRRVALTTGGKHENNGAARVFVAAGGANRVRTFNPVTLQEINSFGPSGVHEDGSPTSDTWESIQAITSMRRKAPGPNGELVEIAEVFVLGKISGRQRITVFDDHGAYLRTLTPLSDLLAFFGGMDAAFGELWLAANPASDASKDEYGQTVLVVDAATGAVKGVSNQALSDWAFSPPERNWWDISIAPELPGGVVDHRVFGRDAFLPGVATWQGFLCTAGAVYICRSGNQRGTDAVPGMRWFMELASYADMGSNRPVQEYSIDKRNTAIDATLINQLLGGPLTIPMLGDFLTPKRTWVTRQQTEGDTVSVSDLSYNSRDVRIDWYGLLKGSDWVRGQKCVGYVVSEADIFVVGDRGERWYELSKQFDEIRLYVDGREFDYSDQAAGHDLCIDTTTPGIEEFADGEHALTLKAKLNDGRTLTVENPNLRIDNVNPDWSFDELPRFVRQTVPLLGTTADPRAGLREWKAEIRREGAVSWRNPADADDPQTTARCFNGAPDPAAQVTIDCPWETQGRFEDGWYEVQLRSRDGSSDNPPRVEFSDPPTDSQKLREAENRIYGTRGTTADDGNRSPEPDEPQRVMVDNTNPTLSVSGHLEQMADFGALIAGVPYPLYVDARDAASGVINVDVLVDGVRQSAYSAQRDCPDGGCSLPYGFNFNAAPYSAGDHTVEIIVRDQVGWSTSVSWPVYIEHIPLGSGASAGTNGGSNLPAANLVSLPRELTLSTGAPADTLLPCTEAGESPNFTVYSLGEAFENLPLTATDRVCDPPNQDEVATMIPGSYLRSNFVSYIYGDCSVPQDADPAICSPPLEVQTWPACERNASSYVLPPETGLEQLPRAWTEVNGTRAAIFPDKLVFDQGIPPVPEENDQSQGDESLRLEVYAGDATIVVFANDRQVGLRAAESLELGTPSLADGVPEELPDPARGSIHGALQCVQSTASGLNSAGGSAAPPSGLGTNRAYRLQPGGN